MKFLKVSVAVAILLITRNGILCDDESSDGNDQASEGPISKQLGISSSYLPQYVSFYQQPQPIYQQPQIYFQPPQPIYQQPQVFFQQPQPFQQPPVYFQQPQLFQQPPVYFPQPQPGPIIILSPPTEPPPSSSSTSNNIWLFFLLLRRLRGDDDSSSSDSGSEDSGPSLDIFGCRTTSPFTELSNPTLPVQINSITDPVGRCIILTATPTNSASGFRIDMHNTDADHFTHMDFRLHSSLISRNSFHTTWLHTEETTMTRAFPLVQDTEATIRVKISSNHYDVYIDDLHYVRYDFRLPASGITYVRVSGAATSSYLAIF